ncbi:MAG TPA: FMN-binding protein [Chromatiales bacterium]|nr:FMN-binding protein [Thiotrichales bacterium]HIP67812.1 FMN-binding protein [Chromatiales bacterium]
MQYRKHAIKVVSVAFCLLVIFIWTPVSAKGVYKTNSQFLQESFPGQEVPPTQTLWLTGEIKDGIKEILGHNYVKLRVKYWRDKNSTAWVLEEIGKERPITAGFFIDQGKLKKTEVLAFRESRGWEIKHPFFTRQFIGAGLNVKNKLDRNIDGITGATLSVSAMTRLSQMALYLHQHVTAQ